MRYITPWVTDDITIKLVFAPCARDLSGSVPVCKVTNLSVNVPGSKCQACGRFIPPERGTPTPLFPGNTVKL
jgi:hypothetical protein